MRVLSAATELAGATPAMRRAAQEFEAQAMSQLLQPAFANLGKGPFGGGAAEAAWRPMLLDAMARSAVGAGQGIGIGDAVLREMLRRQSAGGGAEELQP
ncbi:MAG TPA: rod-binding protein [Crenalkalicoccus sp.]|nr:rod-binding protein [Crenalkalicoccus sp.]